MIRLGLTKMEKDILQELVAHLRRVCPNQVRAVILFGSKARGDSGPASDLDVLLLVQDRNVLDRDPIYDFVLDAELEHGVDISLSVYNADDFDRLAAMGAPFAANVVREGETLWPT